MKILLIIFVILVSMVSGLALFFLDKSANEALFIHEKYSQRFDEIADTECYSQFSEDLKSDLLLISNRIHGHEMREFDRKWLLISFAVATILIGFIVVILQVRNQAMEEHRFKNY